MCLQRTDGFLLENGMHFASIDMDAAVQCYQEEMRRGLRGESSSLPMTPTYIYLQRDLPYRRDVLMIDAGGTNLRLAVARLEEKTGFAMREFAVHPMLGLRDAITLAEFFERMADYIQPYAERFAVDTVGFCFSFYAKILPDRDAVVQEFNKEIKISIEGDALVGAGINAVLARRGCRSLRFVILNDTVASLLGGYLANPGVRYSSYMGFILGTGTNLCYLESSELIAKISAAADSKKMIINCESGMYDGFAQGVYDRALDACSLEPGLCKLEKMVSGAYQGNLIYRTVCGAAEEGLFSRKFAKKLAETSNFHMRDLDAFYHEPSAPGVLFDLTEGDRVDKLRLLRIIEVSGERAARITAVILAATLLQAGYGTDASRPVCVTGEGSGFKKSPLFRQKLAEYNAQYLRDRLGLHAQFVDGENTTFAGAAAAALMECNLGDG